MQEGRRQIKPVKEPKSVEEKLDGLLNADKIVCKKSVMRIIQDLLSMIRNVTGLNDEEANNVLRNIVSTYGGTSMNSFRYENFYKMAKSLFMTKTLYLDKNGNIRRNPSSLEKYNPNNKGNPFNPKDKLNFKENIESEEVTFYSFLSHLKSFLKDLLKQPADAKPDEFLQSKKLTRGKLLKLLLDSGIIIKDEKINDEDGIANMSIKFNIPRKNFENKVRKLHIRLFEKNTPMKKLQEDGEGAMAGATSADSSGQYSQPLFGVQRRRIYISEEGMSAIEEEIKSLKEATTTFNTGNYTYDAPAFADKESTNVKPGFSVERVK